MRILVTGSEGFIGKNMVPHLLSLGHEVFTHDIKFDIHVPHVKTMDWVIHLGAISSTTETDIDKVMRFNYDFSVDLLDKCLYHSVNFQWASSASVYGPDAKEFSESSPANPKSPYSWSKYIFERHSSRFFRRSSIIQGFRYFNVYGPYEDHKGNQASPYHKFKKEAWEDGTITLFHGSENYHRDFVPVQRVLDVHTKFFETPKSGIWNVGTGTAKSFLDVALEVKRSFNDVSIRYVDMPSNIKENYQKYTCADLTKLRREIVL
jgi:ADP-L-glycero-D-manno-heptose 6-epimerase